MTENEIHHDKPLWIRSRIAAWIAAVCLLLLPLLAMQFTDEVDWDLLDFAVFAALLGGTGFVYELVARKSDHVVYRFAAGLALVAALILVVMSLGVGIIGADGDPANLMYFGVIAVGIAGAIITRFKAVGMARTLLAMACTQALITAIAIFAELGLPWSSPAELLLLNGFFIALFVGSAWLFQRAAHTVQSHSVT